eukprot:gene4424-6257_t
MSRSGKNVDEPLNRSRILKSESQEDDDMNKTSSFVSGTNEDMKNSGLIVEINNIDHNFHNNDHDMTDESHFYMNDPMEESSNINRLTSPIVEVQIGPKHFDLLKLIGEGAFGKVILVKNRLDHNLYAMKVISKKLLKKKNHMQYMKSERDILTQIDHPFIVSLYFAFQSETKLFLVMDFLAGGELFFHLKKRGLILEKEVRFYLAEMILAIEFLHNHNIIHRDLKPENVLLHGDGHIAITDFGLAKEIGNNSPNKEGDDSYSIRTLCGTSEYMAPEMLTRNGYGKAVDWWSLGALCFEMVVGKPPFQAKTQKELDKKILSEKFVTPSYLSANTHSLLKGLLDKDMKKRLGAAKSTMFSIGGVAALKRHPFFDDIDWTALERLEIEPPINLTIQQSNNANNDNNTDTNTNNNSNDYLTSHFDEGFTSQQISYSVIEDTLSPSTNNSPMRSRTNSHGLNTSHNNNMIEEDIFANFDYTDKNFECTVDQLKDFEQYLELKIQKANKKKLLKLKNKEKSEIELLKKKQQEEEEKKRIQLENEKRKAEKELQESMKKKLEEEQRIHSLINNKRKEFIQHNEKVSLFQENLLKCQKKLKNYRKKLKDILELEIKVSSASASSGKGNPVISKEQQEKLSKKQEVEDNIMEYEIEEENFIELIENKDNKLYDIENEILLFKISIGVGEIQNTYNDKVIMTDKSLAGDNHNKKIESDNIHPTKSIDTTLPNNLNNNNNNVPIIGGIISNSTGSDDCEKEKSIPSKSKTWSNIAAPSTIAPTKPTEIIATKSSANSESVLLSEHAHVLNDGSCACDSLNSAILSPESDDHDFTSVASSKKKKQQKKK